jgi:hypothetical protein
MKKMKHDHFSNTTKRRGTQSRRGVGVIVGGALLAAILFTSVYLYFFVIMQGQVIRGETDAKIQNMENAKKLEQLRVSSFANTTTNTVNVKILNSGSIPTKIAYIVMFDNKSIPVNDDQTSEKRDITLNPGHQTSALDMGVPADASVTYTIDAITERGNVVTAQWPSQGGIEVSNTINGVLGSLQIDYKSLGVIFTHQKSQPLNTPITKDLVDQRGWDVKFGDGLGYPAFRLPALDGSSNGSKISKPEALVLRVRNVDPSGQDMTLYSNTGLALSIAPDLPQHSQTLYLCYGDPTLKSFEAYNDKSIKKIILPNAFGADLTDDTGWTFLYFCDSDPGLPLNDWEAKRYSPDLNPVTLVARGAFEKIYSEYGQTIPAQAVTTTDDFFVSCLKNRGDIISVSDSCSNTSNDKYRGTAGAKIWVYITGPIGAPPFETRATWINPDGQTQNLILTPSAATNPFSFNVPDKEPDGTPIKENTNYIIQVTDKNGNIYSMTFRVISR